MQHLNFSTSRSRRSDELGSRGRVQIVGECFLAIPIRKDHRVGLLGHIARVLECDSFRLPQPAIPGFRLRCDLCDLDPGDTLRDSNRFPQRLRERFVPLAVEILFVLDLEGGEIPVPLRWESGDGPVGGVQHQIRGGEAELQRLGRAREEDDTKHQHERSEQGGQSVRLDADVVDAGFRCPVELAGNVFVALDDEEGALRVLDHDVSRWYMTFRLSYRQLQGPLCAEADDSRQKREEQCCRQGGSIIVDDRKDGECNGHGTAKDGQPCQRPGLACGDVGFALILGDPQASDRVRRETVAVVQQVCDVVDVVIEVSGMSADGLADCVTEPIWSGWLDKGLRGRQ